MTDATGARAAGAVALTPILSARYRARDLERIAAAWPDGPLVMVGGDGRAEGPLDAVEVVLAGALPAEHLERVVTRAPGIRWVHSAAASVDRVLAATRSRPSIVVTNARGVFSRPVAEYVVMMTLAVGRRLPQLLELQRERTWQPLEGRELASMTVGVVGLGSLGAEIARSLAAVGARVVATRRDPSAADPIPGVETLGGPEALPALLAASDVVVLAVPLTPATEDLIGADELAAMRTGAWLVNVSRPRVVDEGALLRALRDGRVGGAILDAFRDGPLPAASPFYDLENVVITANTSWSTDRVLDRSIALFCENLERYRRGEPLLNPVDPAAGY
ncbi:MAG: D-2-hydroxyacid dehydrogenase [Chloroflexi bacterium]|jgi:phosphoglycerate dehydrogenase-like enzyme|nr:D-2-hydroxyacid dehydrogenase [Chloroflexota bacterium]